MADTVARAGRRLGALGFKAEADAHLQRRLRMLTGVLGVLGLGVFVAERVAKQITSDSSAAAKLDVEDTVMLGALAVVLIAHFTLRWVRFEGRTLMAFDAGVLLLSIGASLCVYVLGYERGVWRVIPLMGVFLVVRAVVVPSTAARTFWLSLPASLGALAIQLLHGTVYLAPDVRYTAASFPGAVLWDQFTLLSMIGVAVVASHVNFRLRMQAFKATRLGQYHLGDKIGEGAIGEVYRATHALLKRPTAVKLLRPEITGEETLKRFEQEVQQTSRLTHPNTVNIFDYGHNPDGVFYYAMELLEGVTLLEAVQLTGPMPAARVIHLLTQVCGSLAEAHTKGLVHRDIKPSNLILCEQGGELDIVKVVDFGLVKDVSRDDASLTKMGAIVGTPETISPEALRGVGVGVRSDLYSLGAVGCYLLTGLGIFDVSSSAEYITQHLTGEPIPPSRRNASVPADIETVLLRCLAKDPEDRPENAAALRSELAQCGDVGCWRQEDAASWWRDLPHRKNMEGP